MPDILIDRRDGVVFATHNRPEALNAFRNRTYDELHRVVKDFAADEACKVLVITGVGRAFSAGQDLKELAASNLGDQTTLRRHLEKTQDITRILYECDKPSIAAINGLAVGVGIEIALGCTVRIAVEESYFQFMEVKRGLFQTNGTLYLLPRIVGLGRAAEMMLTGERISSSEALLAGLITRRVPSDELQRTVETLVSGFLESSQQALRLLKRGLHQAMDGTLEEVLAYEIESNLMLVEASSHLKRINSFVDRSKKRDQ
jgi:enoyl-CoA hydratase/carnithine racemase